MTHRYRLRNQKKELKKELLLNQNKEKKLNVIKADIADSLEENLKRIKEIFGESGDIVIREFNLGGLKKFKAACFAIDGLVNSEMIDDFILRATMSAYSNEHINNKTVKKELYELLEKFSLPIDEVAETKTLSDAVDAALSGDTVLFIDGMDKAFSLNTKGWERRSIDEPSTEAVIRGPRDAFTETLRVSTAQIRRKLKDPDLRIKQLKVGKRTKTDIALLYIDGIIAPEIYENIESRIKEIDIDGILESGYIEQLIEDRKWSVFPQLQYTERPDKAVANLLEGRAVIVIDGTPFVLIAPALFIQFYQSPEDYYTRFWIASFVRVIRLFSLFIALFGPALYIAFSSFHPEMIPSKLFIAMAAGRAMVPFPTVIEALFMEVTIEILREASLRLPGMIGPTIGIVGALVLGQSAVQAGIVSPLMVIVVALTTISSFVSPNYGAGISFRLLRFPMMIIAAIFGLYGIMLFFLLIMIHLASLKSFGVPYMSPISPSHVGDFKDTVIRVPLKFMVDRPIAMKTQNVKRKKQ